MRSVARWAARSLAILSLQWSLETAAAQESSARILRGVVADSTGTAIPFVNIAHGSVRVVSRDDGSFRVSLPTNKSVEVVFRRIGFKPLVLRLDPADTMVTVVMTPVPHRLQAVTVGTELSRVLVLHGFYERVREREQGRNTGWFITPEDIERRGRPKITRLLEDLPSVRVGNLGPQIGGVPLGVQHGGCVMTTYLNGVRLVVFPNQELSAATGSDALRRASLGFGPARISADPSRYPGLDNFISTTTVAGIEVYARITSAPPQYQLLGGNCGVILIWTK